MDEWLQKWKKFTLGQSHSVLCAEHRAPWMCSCPAVYVDKWRLKRRRMKEMLPTKQEQVPEDLLVCNDRMVSVNLFAILIINLQVVEHNKKNKALSPSISASMAAGNSQKTKHARSVMEQITSVFGRTQ